MTMVLVKIIYIYSLFGVPLGNPIFMVEEYPNSEICETYKATFLNSFPQTVNLEYKAFVESECMTKQEFNQFMGVSPESPIQPETPSEPEGTPSVE